MAITFDSNNSEVSSGTSSDVTVSHVLGSGSDRHVVVVQCTEDPAHLPGTPTYDGTAMTLRVDSGSGLNQRVRIYTIGESGLPAAGTYDVVSPVGLDVVDQHSVYVYSYAGAKDQAPEATASNTATSAAGVSVNITTVTDGARIVGGATEKNFTAPTATSGQTNVLREFGGNAGSAAGDEAIATAGSEAFSWSGDSGQDYAVAVIALEPAAASGPSAPTDVVASNPTATTIDLDWTDTNSGSANPRMYRRTPAGSGDWTFVEQLATSATSYTFTGLDPGTEYDLGVSYTE